MRPNPSTVLSCCAALLACACGRLADGDYRGPPLAVIRGTFDESAPLPTAAPISLSLVWAPAADHAARLDVGAAAPGDLAGFREACASVEDVSPAGCDGTPAAGVEACVVWDDRVRSLVQPVDVEAHLGGTFEIHLHDPPPAAALYDLSLQGGAGTFALGRVIAFQDEDGDGALRDGTPSAPPEPAIAGPLDIPSADGWRRSYEILFLDGLVEPERVDPAYAPVVLFAPQGFSVWLTERRVDPYGRPVAAVHRTRPIDTSIHLGTSGDAPAACREARISRAFLRVLPPGVEPAWCSGDHYRARWLLRTAIAPCDYREERYEADFTCASVPPPPWSCPGG